MNTNNNIENGNTKT